MNTQPESTGATIPAHLIPSALGAAFAAASHRRDPRRDIMWGLLRTTSQQRILWTQLMQWTGLHEKKPIAALLFRLQREGLLNGESEPFCIPSGAFSNVLLNTLTLLNRHQHACALANAVGLPVAYSGCSFAFAQRMCLAAPALSALIRTTGHDAQESAHVSIIQSVRDVDGSEFFIRPLYVDRITFYLMTVVHDEKSSETNQHAFVRLMALLGRRYLGAIH